MVCRACADCNQCRSGARAARVRHPGQRWHARCILAADSLHDCRLLIPLRSEVQVMSQHTAVRPLYVQADPWDNVAIVVNEGGLPAGAAFASGLTLREAVPEAHKVTLVDLPAGAPVVRYGAIIGYAETPL